MQPNIQCRMQVLRNVSPASVLAAISYVAACSACGSDTGVDGVPCHVP